MNSFQQWFVRLAAKIAPPLGKVLANAGGSLDRLDAQNQILRQALNDRQDEIREYQNDFREAIALAGGGWLPRKEGGGYDVSPRESDSTAVVKCKEYLAELELAIEDRGWKREQAYAQLEFSRYGIQQLILISRLYYIKNPLCRRGVEVSAYYVFGRGVEVSSPDETANAVLQEFWQDPKNQAELSHTGLTEKEQAMFTDGNLFLALFADKATGRVLLRTIDSIEMEEIITDPNDRSVPRFYHRRWMEEEFSMSSGITMPVSREAWYCALGYDPKGVKEINGKPIMRDAQGEYVYVYHRSDGKLPKWKFGSPRLYPILDWARYYRRYLEDWATIMRTMARFGWDVKSEGGAPALAALKQSLSTTLGTDSGTMWEQNPPPVTGSSFIHSPGTTMTPLKTAGVSTSPEQGRRLLLMVAAGFGLPETFFGDTSTGSLATATSLDRPTELMFLFRQEWWRETIQVISLFVLDRSRTAPKGRIREAIEAGRLPMDIQGSGEPIIEAKFPSVLEHDITKRVEAIVEALTLNGHPPDGIDEKTGMGLLLAELGVEDVQTVLDAMYPEETYQPDKAVKAELQAERQAKLVGDTAPAPGRPRPAVAKESTTLKAVAELTRALKRLQANGHA